MKKTQSKKKNNKIMNMEIKPVTKSVTASVPLKPEDLRNFRVEQDFDSMGVEDERPTIVLGRPPQNKFIRVHPDPKKSFIGLVVEDRDTKESYLVERNAVHALEDDCKIKQHVLAVDHEGNAYIWPIRLPDNSSDIWGQTGVEACKQAKTKWTRVQGNTTKGRYEVRAAKNCKIEPVWPTESFDNLVAKAYGDHIICDSNHPVVRKLNGDFEEAA